MKSASIYHEHYSLEQPHDLIHLATGGFYQFVNPLKPDDDMYGLGFGELMGANGDMGYNETAGFDPIFFAHHSNVDRIFWIWQKMHRQEDYLTIVDDGLGNIKLNNEGLPKDPGSLVSKEDNPNIDKGLRPFTGQGADPLQNPFQKLTVDTPLYPFQINMYDAVRPATSRDCFNINKLGYDYSLGSLAPGYTEEPGYDTAIAREKFAKKLHVENIPSEYHSSHGIKFKHKHFSTVNEIINHAGKIRKKQHEVHCFYTVDENVIPTDRFYDLWKTKQLEFEFYLKVQGIEKQKYRGSFVICLEFKKDGETKIIDQFGVLARERRDLCSNCQNSPHATATFRLFSDERSEPIKIDDYNIIVYHRDVATGYFKRDENTDAKVVLSVHAKTIPQKYT